MSEPDPPLTDEEIQQIADVFERNQAEIAALEAAWQESLEQRAEVEGDG